MTGEFIYGITPQPKETCPIVDNGIRRVQNAYKEVKGVKPDHYEYDELVTLVENMVSNVEYELWDVENLFEQCRQQATDIRNWGQEWKDLAKSLDKEKDELQEEYDLLWKKYQDLEDRYNELLEFEVS